LNLIASQEGHVAVLDVAIGEHIAIAAQIEEIHTQAPALLEPKHDLDARLVDLIGHSQICLLYTSRCV